MKKNYLSFKPVGSGGGLCNVLLGGVVLGTVKRVNGDWHATATMGPTVVGKTRDEAVSAMIALIKRGEEWTIHSLHR